MDYFLTACGIIDDDLSITVYLMPCFDTLDDPEFDEDRDELLQHRSALELVRDQLSDAQRAELDEIDRHWRADPHLFNLAFAKDHALAADPDRLDWVTALCGYVADATGHAPEVPASHWWWNPLPEVATAG